MTEFRIPYPGKGWAKKYGMNAIYAGKHWAARKKDAEYWHMMVHSQLRKQGIARRLYDKPVRIIFAWNDRLDIDNHAYMGKMIVDALKGWLIADDSKRYVAEVVHRFGAAEEITVTVEEMEDER